MSSPAQDLTSYHGSCHCGAVTFTVRTPSLLRHPVRRCNCSICSRNGYLFIYPKKKDVDFHTGYDSMVPYSFGNNTGAHKFCSTCGSSVMMEFQVGDELCINERMIKDIDFEQLNISDVNGKELPPEYKAPQIPSDPDPPLTRSAASKLTPYHANCHCGAVTYTVHLPSLMEHKVVACNCSICHANGYLFVYPERQEVTFHSGHDHLRTYQFGKKMVSHKFCPTCGSSLLIDLNGRAPFGVDPLSVNVRMFQDVDLQELKLNYVDGKNRL